MQQSNALIKVIKQALKQHGFTYQQVAAHLELTEASVKRMFSQQQFTLARIESICQLMALDFTDLLRLLEQAQWQVTQLSEQQEQQLTEDLTLLVVAVSALNHWTMQDMLQWYQLTPTECLQKLIKLDRLKLIELLPQNRIKLKVAPNFSWRNDGPIQRFFQQQLATDFIHHRFNGDQECLLVLNGMLSVSNNAVFQRKLKRLANEFNELVQQDSQLPLSQRHGSSVVLALRDWRFGALQRLLRQDNPS
ncbi:helix-turn-helix domain-containing protein [Alishewanella sp. SMS8]|uniref:helix-turn-helix domain-containing protein n=1 Tax=unclassified Alishewanella TaxID=2628974 RepID=UPI002740F2E1|nr:helix-turn-helix domain-containing protein [Alishewanella sp. SMS8]MDP5037006.1 helix-turn-helix transcriptional regulator [Alishewanella sp.]MDP5186814.1 helix-turn-helix transcriptional regulator [Alishewanella sp.]MDP5460167.1 helix-turn-helix domain-containing protein [Alishewanella sp. SMS8]